jgi:hypothetical protein
MQKERATCDGVQQDRAACLREAGAARQEAGRAGLTTPSPARGQVNSLARCSEQPGPTSPTAKPASRAAPAPPPKAA